MSKKYIPKSFSLDRVVLSHAGGDLDLTPAYSNIEIEENLYNDSLRGKILVLDMNDSFNTIDFDGTETVVIDFQSPGQREISVTLQIYRVEITPDPNSGYGKIYELMGVSVEHYTQSTQDVNKGYTATVGEAADDVFNFLNSDKKFDKHETSGVDTFIVPGMTPFEAMQMLSRRAYSSKFPSSLFTFYETVEGFNFHNVEEIIYNEKSNPTTYMFTPTSNISKDESTQFMIENLEIDSNKDVMYRIKSGSYANQVKEIDLINQTVNRDILLVKDNFGDFTHLDNEAMSYDSKEMIDRHLNVINSTKWIHNMNGNPMFSTNFLNLIPRRRFYYDSLQGVKVRIAVPGNSDLSVGKVINLDMLETTASTERKDQEQKITGNFLVTAVFHLISRKEYSCVVTMCKDSYRANVDNPEKNIVATGGVNG